MINFLELLVAILNHIKRNIISMMYIVTDLFAGILDYILSYIKYYHVSSARKTNLFAKMRKLVHLKSAYSQIYSAAKDGKFTTEIYLDDTAYESILDQLKHHGFEIVPDTKSASLVYSQISFSLPITVKWTDFSLNELYKEINKV